MHDAARLERILKWGYSCGESVEVDLILFWKERAQHGEMCCCFFVVVEGVLLWSLRSPLFASLLGSASLISCRNSNVCELGLMWYISRESSPNKVSLILPRQIVESTVQ